jgi:hypothetical protein
VIAQTVSWRIILSTLKHQRKHYIPITLHMHSSSTPQGVSLTIMSCCGWPAALGFALEIADSNDVSMDSHNSIDQRPTQAVMFTLATPVQLHMPCGSLAPLPHCAFAIPRTIVNPVDTCGIGDSCTGSLVARQELSIATIMGIVSASGQPQLRHWQLGYSDTIIQLLGTCRWKSSAFVTYFHAGLSTCTICSSQANSY